MEWEDIQQALQASFKSAEAYIVSPWFYMQGGIDQVTENAAAKA